MTSGNRLGGCDRKRLEKKFEIIFPKFDLRGRARRYRTSEITGGFPYVTWNQSLLKKRWHEIMWNANLRQQGNFINVFLARHVSGTYAHHQEHWMLSCCIRFSAPSFWMGGGLESRCVGRVYGADGAVARQHPHRTHSLVGRRGCSRIESASDHTDACKTYLTAYKTVSLRMNPTRFKTCSRRQKLNINL